MSFQICSHGDHRKIFLRHRLRDNTDIMVIENIMRNSNWPKERFIDVAKNCKRTIQSKIKSSQAHSFVNSQKKLT
jgi:hypothetical protein